MAQLTDLLKNQNMIVGAGAVGHFWTDLIEFSKNYRPKTVLQNSLNGTNFFFFAFVLFVVHYEKRSISNMTTQLHWRFCFDCILAQKIDKISINKHKKPIKYCSKLIQNTTSCDILFDRMMQILLTIYININI